MTRKYVKKDKKGVPSSIQLKAPIFDMEGKKISGNALVFLKTIKQDFRVLAGSYSSVVVMLGEVLPSDGYEVILYLLDAYNVAICGCRAYSADRFIFTFSNVGSSDQDCVATFNIYLKG